MTTVGDRTAIIAQLEAAARAEGILAPAASISQADLDKAPASLSVRRGAVNIVGDPPPDVGPTPLHLVVPNRVVLVLYAAVAAAAGDMDLRDIARLFAIEDVAYGLWRLRNAAAIADLRRQNEAAR